MRKSTHKPLERLETGEFKATGHNKTNEIEQIEQKGSKI